MADRLVGLMSGPDPFDLLIYLRVVVGVAAATRCRRKPCYRDQGGASAGDRAPAPHAPSVRPPGRGDPPDGKWHHALPPISVHSGREWLGGYYCGFRRCESGQGCMGGSAGGGNTSWGRVECLSMGVRKKSNGSLIISNGSRIASRRGPRGRPAPGCGTGAPVLPFPAPLGHRPPSSNYTK